MSRQCGFHHAGGCEMKLCEVSDLGHGCNTTVPEDINLNSALPSCKLFPSGAACTAAATHFVSQTPDCQATSHKHALSSSD